MAPRLRPDGEPPPVYGADLEDIFTVAVNYDGVFIGEGTNMSYINGRMAWFDFCDRGYWWLSSIQDMLWNLGFDISGTARVFWCLPGFEMMHLGLTEIRSCEDTDNMSKAVALGNKLLCLYVDTDNNIEQSQEVGRVEDDVLRFPRAELPPVISPMKPDLPSSNSIADRAISHKRKSPLDKDYDTDSESDDEDYVPELVDSDYHISEDDDDLYDDSVAGAHDLKGKKIAEPNEELEQEDLQLPDSDDEELRLKFKNFAPEDMLNPTFKVGQVFDSVNLLRRAIKEYSCKNRVSLHMPTNDQQRLAARCEEGCPWYLWASYDNRSKCFMIKRLVDVHTCAKKWKIRGFSYKFIAEKYIETVRADENISLKNLGRLVQKDWCMKVSRSKLGRARKLAQNLIYGDEDAQYNKLWDFASELRRANPGSTFYLAVNGQGRFEQCYFSFDAVKRGFMEGCRPVICLDGCHLKTNSGGILLTAVGVDPNDCIFPFAFAVVGIEDTDSWDWFMSTLKKDLGIHDTSLWTFMSDKQKGLIKAVQKFFPHSEHRFCVRHLWQNFNKEFRGEVLKNQLWKIARCTTTDRFDEAMEEMKIINFQAYKWLEELAPNQWVKAFQRDWPKCDLLLNNISEVFNKYILEARELPILAMIKRIFNQLTTRMCNKRDEALLFTGPICPKIQKKLDKYIELSNNCYPLEAGDGVYSVASMGRDYIVELQNWACSCQRWNLTGIPCHHAAACMREARLNPVDFVNSCYSVESYKRAYAHMLMPLRDMTEWNQIVNCPNIDPPKYEKKVGRKKKNRRKQPEEKPSKRGGVKLSKHGVIIHCSHCGLAGHNKGGCKSYKSGMPPKKQPRKRGRTVVAESDEETEPEITQDHTIHGDQEYMLQGQHEDRSTYANLEETMLKEMMDTLPPPSQPRTHPGPLPESTFISTARESVGSGPSVGSSIAQKAQQMKQEKLRQFEERKEAEVLKKLQEAEMKAQEKRAKAAEKVRRKKEAADQKKLETQQRKAQLAEEKMKAQEEKKQAQAAAKAAAAKEKRIEQEKKKASETTAKAAAAKEKRIEQEKKKASEATAKAAERRSTIIGSGWTGDYPTSKTSMFDIFRD